MKSQPGDIIFVVESDKALQEIEAFDGGILRISPDAPPVGSTVKIGELLAYLVQPGEAPPFEVGWMLMSAAPKRLMLQRTRSPGISEGIHGNECRQATPQRR